MGIVTYEIEQIENHMLWLNVKVVLWGGTFGRVGVYTDI